MPPYCSVRSIGLILLAKGKRPLLYWPGKVLIVERKIGGAPDVIVPVLEESRAEFAPKWLTDGPPPTFQTVPLERYEAIDVRLGNKRAWAYCAELSDLDQALGVA